MIDLLRDLRDADGLTRGSAAVLSEPEPRVEEAQEYEAIRNWLLKLDAQAYLMRASGHYYPYQLDQILEATKPKKVKLIHSNKLSLNDQQHM